MTKIFEIIRSETIQRGVLSFARFMELALYCPNYGYYEVRKDNPGPRGDFYTNVNTGELFGQLLAFQFAEWLEELKAQNSKPKTLSLMEAGAHDGKLARDILTWLQLQRPELFAQVEYLIIEPSPRHREWQKEALNQFAPRVRWLASFPEPGARSPEPKFNGIIFSNELLDAMPVHRFGWDARNKKWFEWGVSIEDQKFIWSRMPGFPAPPVEAAELPSSIFNLPSSLLDVLPEGYTIEISPAAENWWREAAAVLSQGKLMTTDYGLTTDELLSPSRTNGTLRAYFRHHVSDDLLANVGEQDLTAHVNFSAIQSAGKSAGLTTERFQTQPQFLTQILARTQKDKSFGEWDSRRTRQFQTLTHPEHLGRAFRVLVQSR